jgi:hypothetical protein
VGHRKQDFIRFAAEQGAHLNLVDMYGCTALDLATILQHPEVIGVLELLGAERVRTESRVMIGMGAKQISGERPEASRPVSRGASNRLTRSLLVTEL